MLSQNGKTNVFILPNHESGERLPKNKELQGYSELLRTLFSDIPNKYFTSSCEWGNGNLCKKDVELLGDFSIQKTIVLTGGYVGRCLSNTYTSFDKYNSYGKFRVDFDTLTSIHGSGDIGNIEMISKNASWEMLFTKVNENENFDFKALVDLTQEEIWGIISQSLDKKSLETIEKRRFRGGTKTSTQGTSLSH
jgi:hypothetical protein